MAKSQWTDFNITDNGGELCLNLKMEKTEALQCNAIICCERYYLTKYILEVLVFQITLIDIEIEINAQELRRYAYSVEQVCFIEHN